MINCFFLKISTNELGKYSEKSVSDNKFCKFSKNFQFLI